MVFPLICYYFKKSYMHNAYVGNDIIQYLYVYIGIIWSDSSILSTCVILCSRFVYHSLCGGSKYLLCWGM